MDIALDTVSLNHLVRQPRKVRGKSTNDTKLDLHMKARRLRVAIDRSGGIVGEWSRTCGHELVSVLLARWEAIRGVLVVNPNTLPPAVARKLRQAGFIDSGDRLLLRVALATADKIVVSEDSDFWNPRDKRQKGRPSAVVAYLCKTHLSTTVLTLASLLRALETA